MSLNPGRRPEPPPEDRRAASTLLFGWLRRRVRLSVSAAAPSRARLRVLGTPRPPADTDSGQSQEAWWLPVVARLGRLLVALLGSAGQAGFRYRYELTPAFAALGLAMEAEIGHLVSPETWWWGAVPPAMAAFLLGLQQDRPVERLYAVLIGLGAAAWAGAGWAFGPLSPPLWLALLSVGAVAAVPWWRHHAVRGRYEIIGETWQPWAGERFAYTRQTWQDLRRADKDWHERAAEDAGLKHWRIVRMVGDRHTLSFHVEAPSGEEFSALAARRGAVESALDVHRGTISIEPESKARRAVIRWARGGVQRPSLEWDGPSGQKFSDPLWIGEHEDRTSLMVTFEPGDNPHALIGGDPGSGKTALLRLLAAEWAWRRDTFLWGFDVAKRAAGFGILADAFGRLVIEPGDVLPSLQAIERIITVRSRYLAEQRQEFWIPAPSRPQIVVMVDEVAELVRIRGVVSSLVSIARLGRQLGVALVIATQRPAGEALGDSTELRALLRWRFALLVNERRDGALILGEEAASKGGRPDQLPHRGWVLVKSLAHPAYRQARFRLVTLEALAELSGSMPAQPQLEVEALAAASLIVLPGTRPVTGTRPEPLTELRDETAERLELLLQALRELGPKASLRSLAERAFADANKKTWIADRGLSALEAQGRIVGEPGNWQVVDRPEVIDGGQTS